MTASLKLTDARKRGLRVLLDADAAGRLAWVSNETTPQNELRDARVYWQVADWLIREGLATHGFDHLTLTDAGRHLLDDVVDQAVSS